MLTVRLPGGLFVDGERHREATFRPLTGAIELAISEARDAHEVYPVFVTRVLSVAVESVGPIPFSSEVARVLSMADRQVLLMRLSELLGSSLHWLQPICQACDSRFDISVQWSDVPVVEAAADYPFFEGNLAGETIGLRVVTGELEERLVGAVDEEAAMHIMLEHTVDWGGKTAPHLDQAMLESIERQLEEGSPVVAEELFSSCPYCGKDVMLDLNFCTGLLGDDSILEEVHRIAMQYHWSEESIVALPRRRRRQYLKMIDAAQGVVN